MILSVSYLVKLKSWFFV